MTGPDDEDVTDIFDTSLSALFNVPPIAFSTSSPLDPHIYTPPSRSFSSSHSSSLSPPSLSSSLSPTTPFKLYLPHPPASLFSSLQANHLWLSSVFLADRISLGLIDVTGKTVAELGAGASLPSLVACRDGGASVTIASDWGVDEVVSVIEKNFEVNCGRPLGVEEDEKGKGKGKGKRWDVVGHQWGTDPEPFFTALRCRNPQLGHQASSSPPLQSSEISLSQAQPQHAPQPQPQSQPPFPISEPTSSLSPAPSKFDVLLLADTLWVTTSHSALLDSIFSLLSPVSPSSVTSSALPTSPDSPVSGFGGIAHIAAGLHTGRGPVDRFLTLARARGAIVTPVAEVRWKKGGGWVDVNEEKGGEGLEEERGVVVYYTLQIPIPTQEIPNQESS